MAFFADLHIHSKFSRATARNLDLENIYHAAQVKGITVVGTGDFTHPAWVTEMESKLEPAEPGLFSLKKSLADDIDATVPVSCKNPVRFMLQVEISNIYKKSGRVRKNHNIIYFPDLASVKKFNARLDAIGNITSDGRPILGLDARDLLEIMLEINDQGFLVPAHIWTPWFSMFGSKSGFDHITECFEDLSSHIFAVETGLSSDPPMNWRVADLDHVRLMSNSDAHSPGFLGRNASVFNTELDYFAMKKSLETLDLEGYQGTLDMYPDQGKYHFDGHRKCGVSLDPDETARLDGTCPVCGRPLTLGVLHRVRELADRPFGYLPENRHGYTSILPLTDILSDIFQVGPKTKKVTRYYDRAVQALGPELEILTQCPGDRIRSAGVPLLAEAVERMRSGRVHVSPGYDGEYGKVRVFTPDELSRFKGERQLKMTLKGTPIEQIDAMHDAQEPSGNDSNSHTAATTLPSPAQSVPRPVKRRDPGILEGLNDAQHRAVTSTASAILITAGPGTGKTRTLTARIAYLLKEKQVPADRILALTFTNRAAKEIQERIQSVSPGEGRQVTAATFHGFCLTMLREYDPLTGRILEDDARKECIRNALARVTGKTTGLARPADEMDLQISLCKQRLLEPDDDLSGAGPDPGLLKQVYAAYQKELQATGGMDFEDLIVRFYHLITRSETIRKLVQSRFAHVFVDEYQDLNFGQYELVRELARHSQLLVIGDPDQSIYGFRGSDHRFFHQFASDYPGCEQIVLTKNYRSTQTILDASFQMISRSRPDSATRRIYSQVNGTKKLIIRETGTETAEAVTVGKMLEHAVGGMSLDAINIQKDEPGPDADRGFSDFAVLYRTRRQGEVFADVFQKHGIPFQTADKKAGFDRAQIQLLMSCLRLLTRRAGDRDLDRLSTHLLSRISTETGRIQPERILGPVWEPVREKPGHVWLDALTRFLKIEKAVSGDPVAAAAYARIQALARAFDDPDEFMDRLALDRDSDLLAGGVEKVSLLTMHAAKGLEFPVVFVTGCEQGLLPFARNGSVCENPAEERRLFYVAMTRAKDMLCLTYARKRRMFGVRRDMQPSMFIKDIETRLIHREAQRRTTPVHTKPIQLELF
ncbi:MAG: UvrD-helicase domain-containing protein [Desulfotignum sp.]